MNIYNFIKKYNIRTNIITHSIGNSYSVTYQIGGEVARPTNFIINLYASVTGNVVITPSTSNNDGSFNPTSLTLDSINNSGTFVYTPSGWGIRSISYTNNAGLDNPSSHNYVSKIPYGCTGLNIPSGSIGLNLGGFSIVNGSSLWYREFGRIISGEPLSPNSVGIINKLTETSKKLNITVGPSWKGANSQYTIPFNIVSGDTAFRPLKTKDYPTYANPTGFPLVEPAAQQGFPFSYYIPTGVHNGYVHITGAASATFTVFNSGDLVLFWNNGFGYPIFTNNTYFKVQQVVSDTLLILETPYSGFETNYAQMSAPYNRQLTYVDKNRLTTDAHLLTYLRDENTGGADLYESYNTYTSGINLTTSSSAFYDYNDATSPPNNVGGVTAAGVFMTPLILTYDEAVNNRINHCLGMTLTNYGGTLKHSCVWPALAISAGVDGTGVPYGGRFRMRKDWYDANVNNYSPIVQNILTAMRDYGLMVTDGGLMLQVWVAGDDRWNPADFTAIRNIPASALEVPISADAPQWSISGPASGGCGVSAGPWTWNYLIDDNINIPQGNWYLKYGLDPNSITSQTGPVFTQPASGRGPYTFNWTPPNTGLYFFYLLSFNQNGIWNGPDSVSGTSKAQFKFISY